MSIISRLMARRATRGPKQDAGQRPRQDLGPAPKNDLERVQGRWSAKVGPNETPITVEIKDRDVVATFTNDEGRKLMIKGEVRLDESKSPKQVELWQELPRSRVGKILKADVRAQLMRGPR